MIVKKREDLLEEKLEELRDRVIDLSPEQRNKQENSQKIYDTFKAIIDDKNERAHKYQIDFTKRIDEKIEKRGNKKLLEDIFGTSDKNQLVKIMFTKENE